MDINLEKNAFRPASTVGICSNRLEILCKFRKYDKEKNDRIICSQISQLCVSSDSTRRADHGFIGHWQYLELEAFEIGNFGREKYFFSPMVGDREFLWA